MENYYIAVTYDVCEHNDLVEDMNQYLLNNKTSIEKQVAEFAKQDVAPLVKVYQSVNRDFKDVQLYRDYHFVDYQCKCTE
ncbi:hypothetical protein [Aquibacillus sediminis]|uniref:hypothetical protein n=1 Tax=Aquibacillus sediminis TaxID=2574734 RepID=UPI0011095D8C|nr:hypothetical protein [Aquibacillus sediminis]